MGLFLCVFSVWNLWQNVTLCNLYETRRLIQINRTSFTAELAMNKGLAKCAFVAPSSQVKWLQYNVSRLHWTVIDDGNIDDNVDRCAYAWTHAIHIYTHKMLMYERMLWITHKMTWSFTMTKTTGSKVVTRTVECNISSLVLPSW